MTLRRLAMARSAYCAPRRYTTLTVSLVWVLCSSMARSNPGDSLTASPLDEARRASERPAPPAMAVCMTRRRVQRLISILGLRGLSFFDDEKGTGVLAGRHRHHVSLGIERWIWFQLPQSHTVVVEQRAGWQVRIGVERHQERPAWREGLHGNARIARDRAGRARCASGVLVHRDKIDRDALGEIDGLPHPEDIVIPQRRIVDVVRWRRSAAAIRGTAIAAVTAST